jgi:hypothetical protein
MLSVEVETFAASANSRADKRARIQRCHQFDWVESDMGLDANAGYRGCVSHLLLTLNRPKLTPIAR